MARVLRATKQPVTIAAIGPRASVENELRGRDALEIDFRDHVIVPGFVDAHAHPLSCQGLDVRNLQHSAVELEAGEAAGVPNIRFFTQKNLYARRVLDRMGLRAVEREIVALDQGAEGLGRARRLERGVEGLRDQVRDYVERNLLLFARGENEAFREELLKSTRLSNLDRRDYDRMRALVRAIAKRLATRYAKPRRRRLRGQLDARRTIRRNMGWGGIPMVAVWKERRIEKPRVIALCDVSGSVAPMAQFLLMFATLVGTLVTKVLLGLHVQYAALIGVVAGIRDVSPYVGAIACWLPAFFIALFTNCIENAIFVTLGIVVINQLEGNLRVNARGYGIVVFKANRTDPIFKAATVTLQNEGSPTIGGNRILTWEASPNDFYDDLAVTRGDSLTNPSQSTR